MIVLLSPLEMKLFDNNKFFLYTLHTHTDGDEDKLIWHICPCVEIFSFYVEI